MEENPVKPFLKWAGGKMWLAPSASHITPASYGRYYEPFLGGGSMFFALMPKVATLSDSNKELIATYAAIRANANEVNRVLRGLRYESAEFYQVRASKPRSSASRAARFVYLNRTAWNGLYRVNRKGQFNVPFGSFSEPLARATDRVAAAARVLRRARLRACDFEVALDSCDPADFVYLDPPYVSRHRFNGFLRYNAEVFSWSDQERLRDVVRSLNRRGVQVLLSNADHPSISTLYRGFEIRRFARKSLVAGSNTFRTPVTELLIANYELPRRLNA